MNRPLYLFSGCLIPTRLPFLEASSRFVLDRLGVEHSDLPQATCCVEPIGLKSLARDTWLASAARLLSIAEEGGRDILTLCNGCYMSLREAQHALEDEARKREVNAVLREIGREYRGDAEVRHLAGFLAEREEGVRSRVVNPLTDLKLASHPGCHMVRPSEVLKVDRSFRPETLSRIASWTGAEVVAGEDWPKCCGGGLSGIDDELSSAILADAVSGFRPSGAAAILTPCPFCFVQLDLKQKDGLPVLHLSELLALAFGAEPSRIGMQYHRNKLNLQR
ncbi:CoB--CoM heterodisulfide reductase iron-sulfur subunit B family protein [Methanomassiliicoccus luminyensis]|uniref:CoB--CoM heterodisulfide reductase iron-sulfur subunit B family protein n=1 Tax=Methanomassiliicoccus luminyensis TaxID=1080712 RepID=UPI00036C3088|nr:CoB--CoM heterodisulfide reductase iron-sulfur subunit B family protein [Methanomassiliicoccus luminyensis]